MNLKQSTISEAVSISGIGLHTGEQATLVIKPATINHGLVFQRIDLPNKPLIPALIDYVVDTSRSTVLEKDGAKVGTIEHLISAAAGLQIDNLLIEISGNEVPILDGSAFPYVELLESGNIIEQNALRNYFNVSDAIEFKDVANNVEIAALPLDDYRLTAMVDFNSKVLHSQHAQLHDVKLYKEHIAPARTFVFAHDIIKLAESNLIKGGDMSNAVVVAEEDLMPEELEKISNLLGKKLDSNGKKGILNKNSLKFYNEPARHKLLDLMGDLALIGRPLKAHILAARPGHRVNFEFAKVIRKKITETDSSAPYFDANAEPVFNVNDIAKLLPHRYPFQLVDKIMSLDGTTVIGIKNITMNEPQFTGHFPENPVMPGVLMVEAIAQTGGVLVLTTTGEPDKYWPYLVGIDNCRFYKNVLPGDSLIIRCSLLAPIRLGVAKMSGEAWVGKNMVCSVNMTARLVKKT
jgi:UDP-3-O-[3-hydroxymyristoyl] N-acetylglucosamine deacetylase / 3-hydroxyacyl-[acyl-carrier-protein] dehydratase